MKITIGICLKIDPSGLQQKPMSGYFPQLLELLLLKSDSHLPKKLRYLHYWKPFKNDEKALFVLKIFKFVSRLFGPVGKTAWLER